MAYKTQNVSLSEREKMMIQAKAEALGMTFSRLMVIGALDYEPGENDLAERVEDIDRRLSELEELARR
jgi:hypothetical protein